MECEIEYTDEFEGWWAELNVEEQTSVAAAVGLLEHHGVTLGHPYSSQVKSSRHGHMRELRIQHQGRPFRVLYAFDLRRTGILLVGGDKTGNDRWYEEFVPTADRLYDLHLQTLHREGLL